MIQMPRLAGDGYAVPSGDETNNTSSTPRESLIYVIKVFCMGVIMGGRYWVVNHSLSFCGLTTLMVGDRRDTRKLSAWVATAVNAA